MKNYILSWDIRDADAQTLRVNLVALVLSIDPEAKLSQPLLSCLRISSEKDFNDWVEAIDNAKLGKHVFFTFTQIAEDDENILHGEVAKDELQESLEEEGGIIDQAKAKNNKIYFRRYIRKVLRGANQ
jgi:disulfide oxidoreductase YuzD